MDIGGAGRMVEPGPTGSVEVLARTEVALEVLVLHQRVHGLVVHMPADQA
jgi:hypothetical protein